MPDARTGDTVLAALHGRRSIGRVGHDPIPRELVAELLDAAVTAPNHHATGPWRFVVLTGAARGEIGAAHARAVARARPDAGPEALAKEAARLERAPVVVVCAVSPGEDPVEAREDRDAVAAAVQNLLVAAHARGLAGMWRTGAMADEPEVREALGFRGREAIVGFVYLGTPPDPVPGRDRLGAGATVELPSEGGAAVAATVADQVVERVTALMASGDARTQADAIRRVAAEMDRSVSATSSAFYAGRRAAAEEAEARASRPAAGARPPAVGRPRPRLYAEMLPLVEAGATIEQAARRFGDEDEADEIAAGFARWLLDERLGAADEAELAEARRRITALEAETRGLRRDLTRATQALSRVHAIADDALGASRDL